MLHASLESNPYYSRLYMPRETRAGSTDSPLQEAITRLSQDALLRQLEQFRGITEDNQSEEDDEIYDSGSPRADKQILPEYTESLPGTWDREAREIGVQKHYPICHLERRIVNLNTLEHEYRPAYYEEVTCTHRRNHHTPNEICSSLGFSCFQWNKTLHLTRRRYSSDCWETKTLIIPAGCECMWPTHKLGDIKLHL